MTHYDDTEVGDVEPIDSMLGLSLPATWHCQVPRWKAHGGRREGDLAKRLIRVRPRVMVISNCRMCLALAVAVAFMLIMG